MPETSPEYVANPQEVASDRRTEIRQKARVIFLRHGYRKTTVADIGEACGLGKAALYHYYKNKEEIFAEVVRHESMRLLGRIQAAVNAAVGPREKLTAMIMTRFEVIGDILGEFMEGKTLDQIEQLSPQIARQRLRYIEKEAEILEQILDEGQRTGVFVQIDSKQMAEVLRAAFHGMELHIVEVKKQPITGKQIYPVLQLLFDGMCRKRPEQ